MVAIGDVVDDVKSWNPAALPQPRPICYIDLSAVDKDAKHVVNELVVDVMSNEAPSRARQLVATNDVLVSTVRPNLNGVALLDASLDGATASTGYCVLRPSKTKLDPKYLRYWVESFAFVDEMTRLATGASYPAVSDAIIKASKIPLPPLPTQRRIAAVLDKAQALVANDRRTLAVYDQLAKSLFLEMFGDPVRNERGWEVKTFAAIVSPECPLSYGIVQPGDEFDGGVPIVRPVDLTEKFLRLATLKRVDPAIAATFKRTELQGHELLLSVRGSVGVMSFATPELKGANVTRGIVPVWTNGNEFTNEFLYHLFLNESFSTSIARMAKGATLIQVNLGELRTMPVIVPPSGLIQKFDAAMKKLDAQRMQAESSLRRSEGLFGSLLQRAFSGELGG